MAKMPDKIKIEVGYVNKTEEPLSDIFNNLEKEIEISIGFEPIRTGYPPRELVESFRHAVANPLTTVLPVKCAYAALRLPVPYEVTPFPPEALVPTICAAISVIWLYFYLVVNYA